MMRIAVFGAGGIGGYFGGRLAQAGEDIIFIARGQHLSALRTNGLKVDSIKGNFEIRPVQATDDPKQVGQVDVVLLAVKAWQGPEAAQMGAPMLGAQSFIVPLQNGVEAPDQLATVLGAERVLGGMCRISAMIVGPGHIRHVGIEPSVAFGELNGRPSQRVERLAQVFGRAVVTVETTTNIRSAMWEKFLFIVALSGVGAVTRAPIGVSRSVPETRHMLEQTIHEAAAVGRARQIGLEEGIVTKIMSRIDVMQPDVTASMQRDIVEGKLSELESQNGAVIRMGWEAGVPTPMNSFIYASLLPQELRARGELTF
jgi:2-dehydropantoate 2-reductase